MSQIELNHILPYPLKDSVNESAVWKQKLTLEPSNKYLVLADSGKGKSTLLNIIYGVRKDYSGSAVLESQNIANASSTQLSKWRSHHLSYLFQDLRLFGQLSAFENISLKPGCNFTSAEISLYSEKLGIEEYLDKPCNKLSLGQQQRVAILRALSHSFNWLLLDEPFSHLDNKNAEKAMAVIKEIAEINKAGIIATSLGSLEGFNQFIPLNL